MRTHSHVWTRDTRVLRTGLYNRHKNRTWRMWDNPEQVYICVSVCLCVCPFLCLCLCAGVFFRVFICVCLCVCLCVVDNFKLRGKKENKALLITTCVCLSLTLPLSKNVKQWSERGFSRFFFPVYPPGLRKWIFCRCSEEFPF